MAQRSLTDRREARMRQAALQSDNPHLARIVERNIRRISQLRRMAEDSRSLQERAADAITAFSGSMAFVYLHGVFFAVWIGINLITGKKAFDPYPFEFLTMVVSLEAIFLSTFVLVSQNRMQATSDDRDDLDLQVDLLAEYEVTRMLRLVKRMAEQMGINEADDPELEELSEPIRPQNILKGIEARTTSPNQAHPRPTTDVGDNSKGGSE